MFLFYRITFYYAELLSMSTQENKHSYVSTLILTIDEKL